jgi:hypothetical protein
LTELYTNYYGRRSTGAPKRNAKFGCQVWVRGATSTNCPSLFNPPIYLHLNQLEKSHIVSEPTVFFFTARNTPARRARQSTPHWSLPPFPEHQPDGDDGRGHQAGGAKQGDGREIFLELLPIPGGLQEGEASIEPIPDPGFPVICTGD